MPVLVDIERDWTLDLEDFETKPEIRGQIPAAVPHAGHLVDMDALMSVCRALDILVIEDCAHTMGAAWNGVRSGNYGDIACFSTQTYKHLNSGEGGLLTTNDPEMAARAIILSGSYMLYDRHGAAPDEDVFKRIKTRAPNCSSRMDNLRAALLRAQLPQLEANIDC